MAGLKEGKKFGHSCLGRKERVQRKGAVVTMNAGVDPFVVVKRT